MFDWIARLWVRRPIRPRAQVVGHVDASTWNRQVFENQDFDGVDFSGRPWDQWMALGCRFVRCKFGGLRVRDGEPAFGGGGRRSHYVDCSFDRANLRHFSPGLARFERCSFSQVIISDCSSYNADFVACSFSGLIKSTVFWAHGIFSFQQQPNEFAHNDFSQCVFDGVAFRGGIRVSDQRLPNSPDYVYVPDLAAALDQLRKRDVNVACAPLGNVMTTILGNDLNSGQVDALYAPRDFAQDAHEAELARTLLLQALGFPRFSGHLG